MVIDVFLSKVEVRPYHQKVPWEKERNTFGSNKV